MRNNKGQFIKGFGFWTGKKRSQKTNEKVSKALSGRQLSEETKKKMSITRKRLGIRPPSCKGIKLTEEHKRKLSEAHKGRKHRPLTDVEKQNLSQFHKGEKSHLWRGGITPINRAIRASLEYRIWKKKVLERDNSTCVQCGAKDRIEVDHIKPFSKYPELRFNVNNGRVLCYSCHIKTNTYGWNLHNKRRALLSS